MLISLENQLRILAKFSVNSHLRFCPRKSLKHDFHLETSRTRRRYQYHFQLFEKLVQLLRFEKNLFSRNSTKIFHVVCKMKSKEFYGFYYITLSELKERVIQTFIIKLIRYKFCQKNDANEFYGYYENFENCRMDSK